MLAWVSFYVKFVRDNFAREFYKIFKIFQKALIIKSSIFHIITLI